MDRVIARLAASLAVRRLAALMADDDPRPVRAGGVWGVATSLVLAALDRAPSLLITASSEDAEATASELASFPGRSAVLFPALDGTGEPGSMDHRLMAERLSVLSRLAAGELLVVVAPVLAVQQPVPAAADVAAGSLEIAPGQGLDVEVLARTLVDRAFQATPMVESPGEFSRRGGVLDVFPLASARPIRIEFLGDAVESVRSFDPETQRTVAVLDRALLLLSLAASRTETLLDRLPPGAPVAWVEPVEVAHRARWNRERAQGLAMEDLQARAMHRRNLHLCATSQPPDARTVEVSSAGLPRVGGAVQHVMEEIGRLAAEVSEVVIAAPSAGDRERIIGLVRDHGLDPSRVRVSPAFVGRGARIEDAGAAIVSVDEIFDRRVGRRARRKVHRGAPIDSFLELSEGDLVVHVAHGIGLYRGIRQIVKNGRPQEFLTVEFAEGALLHVPLDKIDLVQRYVGTRGARPALSHLGGVAWSKRKSEVEAAVRDLAADLLDVQAARAARPGFAFPPDGTWQREFEAAFPFEDTPDQAQGMEEIRADLEAPRPMDRLICGDVGYGKTELAIRAAFKVVTAGKQVAVLVPTTVLAQQHYETFRGRFAEYPVTCEVLSRFKTPAEVRRVLAGLAEGGVDVVIGTHRLLSGDVAFKDLGLVIVDEEQRFGVAHKERLKRMRATVDVLTLTATPIPRTLHLAMLGVRDISSLTTPPRDRRAIRTRVARWHPALIREAILGEIAREGQVYFVHNRVESIGEVARRLEGIVPEARFAVVHGQLPEEDLETRMAAFIRREVDVLVATTIIESGLDIPAANTIFIDNAGDHYGLADLHQLRGRVGRWQHRASCFLLVDPNRPLTREAEERLRAIEDYSDLGAGFRIAIRDLEIRGAGNILGAEQSGHIASVGYDLYCHLLRQAVRALKGQAAREPTAPAELELDVAAFLPAAYVADARQRIDIYRRLRAAADLAEVEAMREEALDRFGPLPPEAEAMFARADLRVRAERAGIERVHVDGDGVVVRLRGREAVLGLARRAGCAVRFLDDRTVLLVPQSSRRVTPEEAIGFLRRILVG